MENSLEGVREITVGLGGWVEEGTGVYGSLGSGLLYKYGVLYC